MASTAQPGEVSSSSSTQSLNGSAQLADKVPVAPFLEDDTGLDVTNSCVFSVCP